jgi:hypothetical protein
MLDAMAQAIYDVSMSLDGFVTGPDPRPAEPLGDGGRLLDAWMEGRYVGAFGVIQGVEHETASAPT